MDKEIIKGFCEETDILLKELIRITEVFEDTQKPELLGEFGQVIDRIMGAAYTLELDEIGRFCELGKKIGYKASQTTDPKLLQLAGPILADTAEILSTMIKDLNNVQSEGNARVQLEAFKSRLKWFLEKFQNINRDTTES